MTIPVLCFTNVDEFKNEDWPREMVCRPMVGDMVESASGKQLRVVQVAHSLSPHRSEPTPLLKVELMRG